MNVGDIYCETMLINEGHVEKFANFSGDYNPIHFDDNEAIAQGFNSKIAHGMILGGFISKILATTFPGPGTIYLNQELSFRRPVYVGEEFNFKLQVTAKKESKPIFTIQTEVFDRNNELILTGHAIVKNTNVSSGKLNDNKD